MEPDDLVAIIEVVELLRKVALFCQSAFFPKVTNVEVLSLVPARLSVTFIILIEVFAFVAFCKVIL